MTVDAPSADVTSARDLYSFPCTIVQRICWFLDRMSPQTSMMNIAVRFRLEGSVQTDRLEQAVCEVIRRHEVLRTRFSLQDGEPVQIVDPEVLCRLDLVDLTGLAKPEREAEAEQLAADEAQNGFDIERGPLFRARLLRTDQEAYYLLLTMHHIISDGWSVGVVTNEIGEIYEALCEGRAHSLPPLPIQYGDYSCWQKDWIASGELDEQLATLKQKFDGFKPLVLETDYERPLCAVGAGQIRSVLLPRSLTDSLKRLSDENGCTLFVTMLTAFLILMHRDSGQTDILLRTQTAGRDRVELEPLVGWFVNSIVLRTDLAGNPDGLTLLDRVRSVVLDSLEYQDVPFEKLMEVLHPERTQQRHPPFQVNFIFQRDLVAPWQKAGVRMTPVPSKAAGSFCDLNFFLVERRDGWRASVDISTDVFRPETGERFLEAFQDVLRCLLADPRRPISQYTVAPIGRVEKYQPKLETTPYAAPRTALESDIVAIWEDVLEIRPIGVETNFFDLGGHSLLAVPILSRMKGKFGQAIPLAQLFADPTVAAMARAIDPLSVVPSSPDILYIQRAGSLPPFFMVGGDHWFRPLAKRLGPDQPFLGLPLQRYECRMSPTSFEEIGKDLTQIILEAYPSGPFFLGGWCVDGSIAFEVAQQLIAKGKQVALVALMDAVSPEYRRLFRSRTRALGRVIHRTVDLAREAADLPSKDARSHLRDGFGDIFRRVGRTLVPLTPAAEQNPEIARNDPDRQEFRKLLYQSEDEYKPKQISVPLLLLRSAVDRYQDPDLGWRSLARGGLQTIEASGDHIAMFREPHVQNLASVLRRRLETARAVYARVS